MSSHISVNGLGLTYKSTIGLSQATLPDVCKTPSPGGPVPVPYPNIADQGTLSNGTTTVFAKGKMIAIKGSEYSSSTGDEAGTAGGVTSSTFKKETAWITYSFNVKFDGGNACRHTDKKFHNHKNTVDLAGNTDPISITDFEEILSKCVTDAEAAFDSKLRKPPKSWEEWEKYCARNGKKRGTAIGKTAEACVKQKMSEFKPGREDEIQCDQPYTGPPPKPVGNPGDVIKGTSRPDIVLHAPGDPSAVRGVYDFKTICRRGGLPSWGERGALNQGENYITTFQQAPMMVIPNCRIATLANSAMSTLADAMGIALRL